MLYVVFHSFAAADAGDVYLSTVNEDYAARAVADLRSHGFPTAYSFCVPSAEALADWLETRRA